MRWKQTLLIEDNLSRATRSSQNSGGMIGGVPEQFIVSLYSILEKRIICLKSEAVERPETGEWKDSRVAAALSLLSGHRSVQSDVVTVGPGYGGSIHFLNSLAQNGLNFAVEIPSSQTLHLLEGDAAVTSQTVARFVATSVTRDAWSHLNVTHPISEQPITYAAASIGHVRLQHGTEGWLTALQTGAILNSPRGAAFILSSQADVSLEELIRVAGWVRWIKPYVRKQSRPDSAGVAKSSRQWSLRAIRGTFVKEPEAATNLFTLPERNPAVPVRLVELFSGAGGMGLGFFMAEDGPPVNLLYSGEVHPVYAETLRINHGILAADAQNRGTLPADTRAVDLRGEEAKEAIGSAVDKAAGVDIVIGGPPCQGFSSANRHSWHGGNPHNLLIDTYLGYVARLQPKIFVMENVQGIVSSPKFGQEDAPLSVLDYFAQQMTQAGYHVYPKLVDASLYGVPQRRNRCFIVGIHRDLNYDKGDFGSWGPFPKPTHGPGTGSPLVTVGKAIGDLPIIGNGEKRERQPYTMPWEAIENNPFLKMMRTGVEPGIVTDHVTSRHADYVIERYKRIPPGGNWQDIRDQLTNYANAGRTHSNIYRRLTAGEPSITIGHYRKSMIVHPDQPRGLSLREAARLQSFPDWFRFAGAAPGQKGADTLGHKQQQLANAVCPLVTKALAEYLFTLLR